MTPSVSLREAGNLLSYFLRRVIANSAEAARVVVAETLALLKLDAVSSLIVVITVFLFLPTIGRYADNAALLAAFTVDEPTITMQLDGMTARPWGDPSNYLQIDDQTLNSFPPYWLNIRYWGAPYYGGLYLDLALLIWAPLKGLGFPIFPTAPIILRGIALSFSIFTVLGVYNFGRRYFGLFSGSLGCLVLVSSLRFWNIGTIVHPDSLLFFLTVLGLAVCIRHAATDGERTAGSLLAIGVVAGMAQGAKLGGPLLIPIAIISIIVAARKSAPGLAGLIGRVSTQGALVAVVSLIVFFATTPYALLSPYYLKTWRLTAAALLGASPIKTISLFDWLGPAVGEIGYPMLGAAGIAVLTHLALPRARAQILPLGFLLALAITIFLWYAIMQRFWVQIQYDMIVFAIVGLLAGALLDQLTLMSPDRLLNWAPRSILVLFVVAATIYLSQDRISEALSVPGTYYLWRHSTQVDVGDWLSKHKSTTTSNGKVLFDFQLPYVDPAQFPSQYPNGGPIRWIDLARVLPEYFTLTTYRSDHYLSQMVRDQQSADWDSGYWNMSLYQELLGRNAGDLLVGDDPYPFVRRVATFGYAGVDPDNPCDDSIPLFSPLKLDCLEKTFLPGPGIGLRRPSIALFKLDADTFIESLSSDKLFLAAAPLASSSSAVGAPENAINSRVGNVWRSANKGEAAEGEFIGANFRRNLEPRSLTIKWVASSWMPGAIDVEYSDDGKTWSGAGSFKVATPPDLANASAGGNRWKETFTLSHVGAHSSWRVVARKMPPKNFFGVEFVQFD